VAAAAVAMAALSAVALQAAISGSLRLLNRNRPPSLSLSLRMFPQLVFSVPFFKKNKFCGWFCNFSWLVVASKMNLREAKDDAGRNALHLHLAAEMGHLDVCRFLVEESGFDVNSVCAEGAAAAIAVGSCALGDAGPCEALPPFCH
jgi:hypothetical protein